MNRSSKWRIFGRMMGVMAAAMMIVAGCGDDDPDTSELDSYFADHPYVSDPRSGSTSTVSVSPDSATVNAVGGRVVFTASGGNAPYHWDVSNGGIGSIAGSGAQGIYTASAIGDNDIIVYDQDGNCALARITGNEPDAMSISASPQTVEANGSYSVLSVTGGTPPYSWSVADPDKGRLPSGTTGETVTYRRITAGDNVVTVTDGNSSVASLVISQP